MLNISDRLFSRAVSEIYEASHKPEHWPKALNAIRQLTFSPAASIMRRTHSPKTSAALYTVGWSKKALLEYNNEWGARDLISDMSATKFEPGKVLACYQMEPDREKLEQMDPEYWAWVKRSKGHYSAGTTLPFDEHSDIAIAIQRPRFQGPWNQLFLDLFQELIPHIKRALIIHQKFSRLHSERNALLAGLEQTKLGTVLFDMTGQITFINDKARSVIEQHPAISLSGSTLRAARKADNIKLHELISRAIHLHPEDVESKPQSIGLRTHNTAAPLPIIICPVNGTQTLPGFEDGVVRAALYINEPDLSSPINHEVIQDLYQLTPTETRLACALVNGLSPKEYAAEYSVSINTVRTQLRALFRKTNTNRQPQLIKTLLSAKL